MQLRLELAQQGLPSGGSIGYELFDHADSLGSTNFVQNVNLVAHWKANCPGPFHPSIPSRTPGFTW